MKEMNYAAADMTMQRYVFSEQRGLSYCLSNKPQFQIMADHAKRWFLTGKLM